MTNKSILSAVLICGLLSACFPVPETLEEATDFDDFGPVVSEDDEVEIKDPMPPSEGGATESAIVGSAAGDTAADGACVTRPAGATTLGSLTSGMVYCTDG